MRTPFPVLWSIASLTLAWPCLVQAETSGSSATAPTHAQVREAINRSVPFMEKEGLAWMDKRGCVSCHQIPAMVWSFNALQRHGFTVDAAKVCEWNEWALKGAFDGKLAFKLAEKSFAELLKNGASPENVDKLRALKDREFLKESDFWHAVAEQVGPEIPPQLKEQINKSGAKPGVAPGLGGTFTAIYPAVLHAGVLDAVKTPDPDTGRTAIFEALLRDQQKDGLWASGGQFMGMNRPKEESTAINSAWILLALSSMDSLPENMVAARDRASVALAQTPPGVSTESTLVRLLLAHRASDAKLETDLLAKLLQLQRPDGGWAFRTENPSSDALTTGQVLYSLRTLGQKNTTEPVQHAVRYLLQNQQPDGSWSVPWINFNVENHKDHTQGTQIFSYWGSGWAIVGLLETLES